MLQIRDTHAQRFKPLFAPFLALMALSTAGCEKCAGLDGEARDKCEAEQATAEGAGTCSGGTNGSSGEPSMGNDTENNLISGCEALGEVQDTAAFEGFVNGGAALDFTDFFCFSIPTYSTITVSVVRTQDVGGPVLNLYQYANTVTREDVVQSTGNSASWDLPPGRYAIQMSSDSLGLGLGYQGNITRTELTIAEPSPEPGSTTDKAVTLEVPDSELMSVEGHVGLVDKSDLYEVNVPESFSLGIQLEHIGGGGRVSLKTSPYGLVTSFGEAVLAVSAGAGISTLAKPLTSGHHLLEITGEGAYRIQLALVQEPTPP